jgi:hypothetical protein
MEKVHKNDTSNNKTSSKSFSIYLTLCKLSAVTLKIG